MNNFEKVKVSDDIYISNNLPFVFIAGPCQIESRDHSMMVCDFLSNLCKKLDIPFIFKASYDKANRTSVNQPRGVGLEKSIKIFEEIKSTFKCPVLTDIHTMDECRSIGGVVDVLQVPALLCRQTDLIKAACENGKVVNIKKGQFLAPWDMKNVVEKCHHFGNKNILLTERGTSFGYNNLVVDMTSINTMSKTGKPVIIDATHAVQKPGGLGNISGGNREEAMIIARSAVAGGPLAGVFCEVHNDPDKAFSDGPNSLNFKMTEELLPILKKLDALVKNLI